MAVKEINVVDSIMAYEAGELSPYEIVLFFGVLVKSGMAWSLQGCYGRAASALIEQGFLKLNGDVVTERLLEIVE